MKNSLSNWVSKRGGFKYVSISLPLECHLWLVTQEGVECRSNEMEALTARLTVFLYNCIQQLNILCLLEAFHFTFRMLTFSFIIKSSISKISTSGAHPLDHVLFDLQIWFQNRRADFRRLNHSRKSKFALLSL